MSDITRQVLPAMVPLTGFRFNMKGVALLGEGLRQAFGHENTMQVLTTPVEVGDALVFVVRLIGEDEIGVDISVITEGSSEGGKS